jgi:hypothetical protein
MTCLIYSRFLYGKKGLFNGKLSKPFERERGMIVIHKRLNLFKRYGNTAIFKSPQAKVSEYWDKEVG